MMAVRRTGKDCELPAIDMTGWSTAIVARFKSLFNVDGLSDEVAEFGPDGESEDGKASRLAATARVRNDWMKNGLASMLSEDQSGYLVSVLREPSLADLSAIVRTMAGQFVPVWRERDMTIVATQLGFADDSDHPAGQLPHRDDDPAEDLMGLGFEPVGNRVRFKVTSTWDSGQQGEVLSKVETS